MRGGTATRGQNFLSVRGSNKSSGKSRPYRPQASSWNQSSQPYEQTLNNPFGAFDPNNQAIYPSNDNNYYSSTKRSTQYEQNTNEYDGFFPKRARTYNNASDASQNFYPTDTNYYPASTSSTVSNYALNTNNYSSQTNDYSNQPSVSQSSWQYQTEPHYEQHQYSNPGSSSINPMRML